jgi:predicted RNase H-like nuclease (RuvC/YqgF family)
MNYSFLYKNYKNTIFYLLFGVCMIILLTQFDYIKKSIIEGFDFGAVRSTIDKLKSETNQLNLETDAIKKATQSITDETERIRQSVNKLTEETKVLDADRKKIDEETAALRAQYSAEYQSQAAPKK